MPTFLNKQADKQTIASLDQICTRMVQWIRRESLQAPEWSDKTWEVFELASRVHGVAPLLAPVLKDQAWVPVAINETLSQQYRLNQARITKMHQDLADILACFAQNQIAVLPMKGAVISPLLCEDPALRPMADLDLLVRQADWERVSASLIQLGYVQDVVHWKHTEFIKPDNREVVTVFFEHPDNPRGVEVHLFCRESFGGPGLDLTDLMWRRASPGLLGEQSTVLPALEVLWLHTVVHATYHFWQGKGRLIQLLDLRQLTPKINQPETVLTGIDARYTYPALALLRRYFSEAVPDRLLASQSGRVSAAFRDWIAGWDLVYNSALNPAPSGLYLTKALRFAENRPGEILRALRFAFLPDLDELSLDHPKLAASPFPWLAYFFLPLDWAKRLIKPYTETYREDAEIH